MRVVIVADSPLSAERIRQALRYAKGMEVAGFVNAGRSCEAAMASAAPDLIVVDDLDDRELVLARVAEGRRAARDCKIVLLARTSDADWLRDAAIAGVNAAVSRDLEAMTVGTLVGQIARGTVFHAFAAAAPVAVAREVADLTARELEILRLVASGASNGQIARQLWVTEQTVKFHLSNTYRKLGVANRTEASHFAHVNGLLGHDHAAQVAAAA